MATRFFFDEQQCLSRADWRFLSWTQQQWHDDPHSVLNGYHSEPSWNLNDTILFSTSNTVAGSPTQFTCSFAVNFARISSKPMASSATRAMVRLAQLCSRYTNAWAVSATPTNVGRPTRPKLAQRSFTARSTTHLFATSTNASSRNGLPSSRFQVAFFPSPSATADAGASRIRGPSSALPR